MYTKVQDPVAWKNLINIFFCRYTKGGSLDSRYNGSRSTSGKPPFPLILPKTKFFHNLLLLLQKACLWLQCLACTFILPGTSLLQLLAMVSFIIVLVIIVLVIIVMVIIVLVIISRQSDPGCWLMMMIVMMTTMEIAIMMTMMTIMTMTMTAMCVMQRIQCRCCG